MLSALHRTVQLGFWLFLLATAVTGLRAADTHDELPPGMYARIETPRGTMIAELYFERVPLMVANFVGLAEGRLGPKPGVPFYDGLTFHRVVPDFVIQGGDPVGTGEGGPGYEIPDQFDPRLSHDTAGILSMANDGPDTNGSQFFITLVPARRLDFLHSVFGRVIRGLDVLPRIAKGDTMKITILRNGRAAKTFASDRAALDTWIKKVPRSPIEPPLFFVDEGHRLPSDPPRARNFDRQLANVFRATGIRIFARLAATPEAAWSESQTEKSLAGLAKQLGVERNGALAVYSEAGDTWQLWIGRDDLARTLGREKKIGKFDSAGELEHRVIEIGLDRGKRWIQEAEKLRGMLLPNEGLKHTVDGVLQELIDLLVREKGLGS